MAEKDSVYKGKIKQSGIFNFKDFYEFLYVTIVDFGYDLHEARYLEKTKGDSKEVEIGWVATSDLSNYFGIEIKIDWIILGMKKVQVKKNGQEVSMDSGTLEVTFSASLMKDVNGEWENMFFKRLREIYDKYIIKERIKGYEDRVFEEVSEFIEQAKSFLTLEGLHDF
ncbi:hypothetical protein CMI42_00260 [Candidatus Pacearchaeota archaeon]|nr:hypothetical protein [Candidatus Pacearchaeota archaeon]